jgi:hypothetical protein
VQYFLCRNITEHLAFISQTFLSLTRFIENTMY